jgi:hypothetical protein
VKVRTGNRNAVLAPKLVLLRTILGVGIGDYVSAPSTTEAHDSPHLVMRKLCFMALDLLLSDLNDHIARFTIIDGI